jgi:hypothetical protein
MALEGIDHVKESVRDVRSGAALGQIGRDVRYAVRTLVRTPGFTIFTLLTFAIAIGGLTVIFTLVNAVLLRPLPYLDSDRLVMVLEADVLDPRQDGGNPVAAPNFQDWQRRSRAFRQMALYEYQSSNLGDGVEPEQVGSLRVSGGVFDLLAVRPLLGRGLLPADDSLGHQVVVLSHRLWQRRYQGDSSIVGTSIRINNAPWEVIGVMPEGCAKTRPRPPHVPRAPHAVKASRGANDAERRTLALPRRAWQRGCGRVGAAHRVFHHPPPVRVMSIK